jgi:DNA-binding LytR/AlgR family response regulator
LGDIKLIRIAICDDDEKMQNNLKTAITDWAMSKDIYITVELIKSAEEFLMIWPETSFDLAFLDIEMNAISGVELAKIIRKQNDNMLIVFVTSHSQYVLRGYDVNAMHYLIKPVSMSKLLPILDKAYTICKSQQSTALVISDNASKTKLQYSNINYITVQSHDVSIYTNEKTYVERLPINKLVNILPDYFIRIHRSHIVNLYKVDVLYKEALVLSSGEKLPISRNNYKQVSDLFMRLSIGK